jgi:hypothetical protein
VEENHKSLHQEEGVIVIQAIFDDVFEEALGFRVSSEHGGGHDTAKEERHSPPRWPESYKELVHEVYRTLRAYGGAARPTLSIDPFIHSTSIHSAVLRIWLLVGGGGEEVSRLEKRLVANVDFDDPALNSLGFGTDIYYMLGHLGWVQFSNGVLVYTHKEFVLENLMTMRRSLMRGYQVYHSDWRGFSKWFPMSTLGSYLGSKRGLQRKLMCRKTCWMDFGI